MDWELLIWVVVFVGGYSAVLAYLLRIVWRSRGKEESAR